MPDPRDHPTILETLHSLIGLLPATHPSYCLIGALALGAWGQVRATQDIDLLVLFENDELTELEDRLKSLGFTRDVKWSDANPMLRGYMVRFRHVAYPLDLLSARDAHDTRRIATSSEYFPGRVFCMGV